jgi:hypothetical protein
MDFFRANSAGFNNFANSNIGTYSWDATKQMYLAGGQSGGNLQIYGVEHLRPPFKASMEFECTQTPRVVQVGAIGNPTGDLNDVNSFLNQINIVTQRSENRSTFTQRWVKSNNTNVQLGDYTGPTIPLNVKCRMTVTVFSTTSVEIRVERADGTAITNGVYTNSAVSPEFSSTLDWRPYFQIESPGIYFGNFKFEPTLKNNSVQSPETYTMTSTSVVTTEVEMKFDALIASGDGGNFGPTHVSRPGINTGLYWYQLGGSGDGFSVGSAGGRIYLSGSASIHSTSVYYKYRMENSVQSDVLTVWDHNGVQLAKYTNTSRDANSIKVGDTVKPALFHNAGRSISYKNFTYKFTV